MTAAEIFYNSDHKFDIQIIMDLQTSEVTAMYKGDPICAAAAFVCMQHECSKCGKYHDFYCGK